MMWIPGFKPSTTELFCAPKCNPIKQFLNPRQNKKEEETEHTHTRVEHLDTHRGAESSRVEFLCIWVES